MLLQSTRHPTGSHWPGLNTMSADSIRMSGGPYHITAKLYNCMNFIYLPYYDGWYCNNNLCVNTLQLTIFHVTIFCHNYWTYNEHIHCWPVIHFWLLMWLTVVPYFDSRAVDNNPLCNFFVILHNSFITWNDQPLSEVKSANKTMTPTSIRRWKVLKG